MHSRRSALKGVAAFAATVTSAALPSSALSRSRIIGANDRLRVAAMGVNGRGKALALSFANMGADISHVIDVDRAVAGKVQSEIAATAAGRQSPAVEYDFRRVLDDQGVDALIVATPDHWHAPATILALAAGKHVYVEKPCGHNPHEGELLVAAQQAYGGVVQLGNQQRSSQQSIELIGRIRDGELGRVYLAETWYSNGRGTIGNGKEALPPSHLDWDLWQGPAPRRGYQDNVVHYNWHWFWRWGTGETCNNAMHELDIARWALDVRHPKAVDARGSRQFFQDDDWEMYDTLDVQLEYEGDRRITWSGHACNPMRKFGRSRGVLIYGTDGSAIVDREGYEIYDQRGRLIDESKVEGAATNSADTVGAGPLTDTHIGNFIETVQGRAEKQNSPIDEGVISTDMCHLANIAYRTNQPLEICQDTGRILTQAGQPYWSRDYEPGWEPKV